MTDWPIRKLITHLNHHMNTDKLKNTAMHFYYILTNEILWNIDEIKYIFSFYVFSIITFSINVDRYIFIDFLYLSGKNRYHFFLA